MENTLFSFRGPWGVPVEIQPSILFLGLLFMGLGMSGDIIYSAIFFGMLVFSIFLHELGHAWGAVVQGIPVRRVVLYAGGGYCQRARSASAYQDELIVAMGPIVTAVLWAVPALIAPFFNSPTLVWGLYTLSNINLFLLIFNLMPVMPLDGGRLFQLILGRFMPRRQATVIAGYVGLLIAVAWIPLMIFAYVTMGFVLLFMPSFRLHLQMIRQGN